MSSSTWTPRAVSSEAVDWRAAIWRVVEAQHVTATMKLVDNAAEQDILEALLETSKPPFPDATTGLGYLLATPFRYDPLHKGSRFRAIADPGVFYGAGTVRTACAEVGFARWKFLIESDELTKIEPVAHTAFRVDVQTRAVNLQIAPFDRDTAKWTHPDDYSSTQSFARAARQAGIGAIVYKSVRDRDEGWCAALLTPTAFQKKNPHPAMQTWWLAVYPDEVVWRREREVFALPMR